MNPQKRREIYRRLQAANPSPTTELEYRSPFELLVAVVLSAQATDKSVNLATAGLFRKFDTPQKMAKLTPAQLEGYIKTIGLFRTKAKNVIALSKILVEEHGGEVPAQREALERLPGVGRKTANVVLGNAFGVPGITVDTHFGRLVRRFGWTDEEDPVKVEHAVGALFDKRDWTMLSHRVIFHGRRVCHARTPACGACALAPLCPSVGLGPMAAPAAAKLLKGPRAVELAVQAGIDPGLVPARAMDAEVP